MNIKYFISKSNNFKELINEVSKFAYDEGVVTKKFLKEVLKREKKASFYIGNGLIIPHPTEKGRKEIIGSSTLIVNWFNNPISYRGNNVHFSITIASSGEEHMDILSKIAVIFSDDKKVKEMMTNKDEKTFRRIIEN